MAKGKLKLPWHKDNVTHKVKPPKAKPRDERGYIYFLIYKRVAIERYLESLRNETIRN
jgi:hypothetical protein